MKINNKRWQTLKSFTKTNGCVLQATALKLPAKSVFKVSAFRLDTRAQMGAQLSDVTWLRQWWTIQVAPHAALSHLSIMPWPGNFCANKPHID